MIPTKPGKFAILITGAVTSGKSSLAHSIDTRLFDDSKESVPFINEESTGSYYKIIDRIDPFKYPIAVYDHCWIQQKWFLFEGIYQDWKVIMLKLSKDMLEKNYRNRLQKDSSGDFQSINPHEQQITIMDQLDQIKTYGLREKIKIFEISKIEDYEIPVSYGFQLLKGYIENQ